ncbi:MAG: PQQ-binding-like beta-propeller repeat protein [Proteobacteria bacterium]|nr:PQQ-binding-like beta-propeller repeat protein [Pseudomonadota bacterium]
MSLHCVLLSVLAGLTTVGAADSAVRAQNNERIIQGVVFADLDQDGLFSANDETVAGAVVFWEGERSVVTDSQGNYELTAPARSGIVWVRVPDGYKPGPVWHTAGPSGDVRADLPLIRTHRDGPLMFVVASDTHTEVRNRGAGELRKALEQATDILPEPYFIAVTGDITQANKAAEFEGVLEATAAVKTPYVPIPGNHDWYDKGVAYRQYFGPPNYSFDAGGVHFIVLNDQELPNIRRTFLDTDLAAVAGDPLLVAFIHAPPDDAQISLLEAAGIDYLFSGHLHSNRILVHDSLLEYNTQPLLMGGIDLTPAGYRVVALSDAGDMPYLSVYHRTITEGPVVTVSYPRPSEYVAPCEIDVIAAVEYGAGTPQVTVQVADRDPVTLDRTGGWNYQGTITDLCQPGLYDAIVVAKTAAGHEITKTTQFCVASDVVADTAQLADWPQLGGDPRHQGRASSELAPPLRTVWARSVGQNLHGSSPALVDGRLFVPITDFGDGTSAGVVALDAHTGEELWRHQTGFSVRGAPAVARGIAVIAANNGTVHAVDAVTGDVRWTFQLGAIHPPAYTSLYTSPTIVDSVVYIGIRRELVALDIETGEPIWTTVPSPTEGIWGTHAAVAVNSGVAVSSFAIGKEGLIAWDPGTGQRLWQTDRDVTIGLHASPVIADNTVYTLNWSTTLHAVDLFTGTVHWARKLASSSGEWRFGAAATPAIADGMLYVPLHEGYIAAIDAASGVEGWRFAGRPSSIHPAHYQTESSGFSAAPVVTGSLLWVGGSDGTVTALDRASGKVVWEDAMGSPIAMGLVASGTMLFIATYDGVVRAMRSASDLQEPAILAEIDCPTNVPASAIPDAGCGCRAGEPAGLALESGMLLVLAFLGCARRRRSR